MDERAVKLQFTFYYPHLEDNNDEHICLFEPISLHPEKI